MHSVASILNYTNLNFKAWWSEECQDGVMVTRVTRVGGRQLFAPPPRPKAELRQANALAQQGGFKLKAASWVCLSVCASVRLCVCASLFF